MTKAQAQRIARSFQTFLDDYKIPHFLDLADERAVIVKTINTTLRKNADASDYHVVVWERGKRAELRFSDHWDALFFVRMIERMTREGTKDPKTLAVYENWEKEDDEEAAA